MFVVSNEKLQQLVDIYQSRWRRLPSLTVCLCLFLPPTSAHGAVGAAVLLTSWDSVIVKGDAGQQSWASDTLHLQTTLHWCYWAFRNSRVEVRKGDLFVCRLDTSLIAQILLSVTFSHFCPEGSGGCSSLTLARCLWDKIVQGWIQLLSDRLWTLWSSLVTVSCLTLTETPNWNLVEPVSYIR